MNNELIEALEDTTKWIESFICQCNYEDGGGQCPRCFIVDRNQKTLKFAKSEAHKKLKQVGWFWLEGVSTGDYKTMFQPYHSDDKKSTKWFVEHKWQPMFIQVEAQSGEVVSREALTLAFRRGVEWMENHNPDTDDGWGKVIDSVIAECLDIPKPAEAQSGETNPWQKIEELRYIEALERIADKTNYGHNEQALIARKALESAKAEVQSGESTPLVNGIEVEVVCNGEVHYRRPWNDRLVQDALKTSGYSIRVHGLNAGKIQNASDKDQSGEEWERAGLTPQQMWDEIQAIRKITSDDGTFGNPHVLVKEMADELTRLGYKGPYWDDAPDQKSGEAVSREEIEPTADQYHDAEWEPDKTEAFSRLVWGEYYDETTREDIAHTEGFYVGWMMAQKLPKPAAPIPSAEKIVKDAWNAGFYSAKRDKGTPNLYWIGNKDAIHAYLESQAKE